MKQKGLRKLVSMILAVVMCLGLTCTALAATSSDEDASWGGSIVINNANAGETYSIYLLATVTYDTNDGKNAYSYIVNDDWKGFFTNDETASEYFTVDSQGYLTVKDGVALEDDSAAIKAIAEAALAYANENNIAATDNQEESSSTVMFMGLDLGYYLIDSSAGTLCSLTTTDAVAYINEKNLVPIVDKQVVEDEEYGDNNTAGIGDIVEFKAVLSNIGSKSSLVYHDTMSSGLSAVADTTTGLVDVIVKLQSTDEYDEVIETEVDSTNYTVTGDGSTLLSDGCTFEVTFDGTYLDSLSSDAVIVIYYNAEITEDAVINGGETDNTNKAKLSYGVDSSVEDETTTYVYGISIYKYTEDDSKNKTALSGAVFTLTRGSDDNLEYAVVSNGTLTGWSKEKTTLAASDVNGLVYVNGLDAGEYTLTETDAPDGYNKLAEAIIITIDQDGTVTYKSESDTESSSSGTVEITENDETVSVTKVVYVLNNAGTALPSTGGMGTTIFYIVGGVLVLGAAVLFVTKKRLGSEN